MSNLQNFAKRCLLFLLVLLNVGRSSSNVFKYLYELYECVRCLGHLSFLGVPPRAALVSPFSQARVLKPRTVPEAVLPLLDPLLESRTDSLESGENLEA